MTNLNTYELIDKMRPRVGMYIGHLSPTHLRSFLDGYSFGNSNATKPEHPDFGDFHDWVAKKFDYYESTSGWAYMIEDQRKDQKEALWLFFELLDEFRGIKHETIQTLDYTSDYKLNTTWIGYSRQKKVRGSFKAMPKPRPTTLIIHKLSLDEPWFSLNALNEKNEIMDVRHVNEIDRIYGMAYDIYGVHKTKWT